MAKRTRKASARADAKTAADTDASGVDGAPDVIVREPLTTDELMKGMPQNPDELHAWIERYVGVHLVRVPIVRGHAAPMDYLVHSFFEGCFSGPRLVDASSADADFAQLQPSAQARTSAQLHTPATDCVVWANRGGGKTFLGALATLLDLIFKQKIQVRILGGSLEQSKRMYEHLRLLFERPGLDGLLKRGATKTGMTLVNGSRVELLAASQTSVRGTRVQKLRCDEVELFDPEVWEACQLTTRSMACVGPWGNIVHGSVQALSTMHLPYGIMWKLVEKMLAGEPDVQRPVFRWGLVDVLERCGDEHVCERCVLQGECGGRAKQERGTPVMLSIGVTSELVGGVSTTASDGDAANTEARGDSVSTGSAGHIRVSDAVAMKRRVGRATWDAEMLCVKPRRDDCVYPEFDVSRHVYVGENHLREPEGRWVMGMDFGIRSETAILLGRLDARGRLFIVRERVLAGETLHQHIQAMAAWMAELGEEGETGKVAFLGVDPAGLNRSTQTGKSDIDLLKAAGFPVRSRRFETVGGIAMVRARIAPAASAEGEGAESVSGFPEPRLFVHASCTRLIECLQRYHYDANRPECNEPVKDGFDHACDALRYLVINIERGGKTLINGYADR